MHKDFIRTTELSSLYQDIEKMSALEIISNINTEDKKVAFETVVRVIDKCQHIKSSEKKVPANIKTKY